MGASRPWALPAALVLAALCAHPAHADDKGLHLRHLDSPRPGQVRAFVSADAALTGVTAADLSLLLDGGIAPDLKLQKNRDRGGLTTLVVLDDSSSYRVALAQGAMPLLRRYVSGLDFARGDRVGIIPFGADAKARPLRATQADVLKDLDDIAGPRHKPQRDTNLLAGLDEAGKILRQEQEAGRAQPGLTEIIVLTDAGNEVDIKDQRMDALSREIQGRVVRVSAVVTTPRGSRAAKALNGLRELARITHGVYENADDPAQAVRSLQQSHDDALAWLVVEARQCGLRPGASSVAGRIEYGPGGQRTAWTESKNFTVSPAPGVDAPCRASACAPACAAWERCTAGACRAQSCGATESCGPGARCANGTCAAEIGPALLSGAGRPFWHWALGAAGALLLAGTALMLWNRSTAKGVMPGGEATPLPPLPAESPAAVPPPSVSAVGAVVAPAPAPETPPSPAGPVSPVDAAVHGPLTQLPEVHLQAIGGSITVGERWRLHKPKMYAGGDRSLGNDLVFDIPKISGRHALFELFPSGDLWITDQAATNGTFVNNRRLEPRERARLRPGDQVKLSQNVVLQVVRPGFPAAKHAEQGQEQAPAVPADVGAPAGKAGKRTVFDPGNR